MKKLALALGLLLGIAPFASAQEQVAEVTEQSQAECLDFQEFEYQGFKMNIPINSEVSMTTKEAIVKCKDGTFGMSLKIEKDKGATPNAAYEMCKRMVTELDVKDSKITKVMVHGMQGAKLEGVTEGAPVSVLILATKDKYVKMVIICTPEHAAWANIVTDSIAPLP